MNLIHLYRWIRAVFISIFKKFPFEKTEKYKKNLHYNLNIGALSEFDEVLLIIGQHC